MMTPGGEQNVTIINESGLYSLVISSKLPSAKKFKHWVTAEMLPSIRRHGAYATAPMIEKIIASPEFGIALLLTFQNGTFGSQDIRQKGEKSRKYKKTKDQPSQCRTVAFIGIGTISNSLPQGERIATPIKTITVQRKISVTILSQEFENERIIL